jgi:large subunit ribosomal protein L18
MTNHIARQHQLRDKRKMRVRKKLHGTQQKPRLTILKSNKHIHAQLINDDLGVTIGAVSTVSKKNQKSDLARKNKETARKLGEQLGAMAIGLDIKEVLFDRGPYKYHGILAELADGARSAGLKF